MAFAGAFITGGRQARLEEALGFAQVEKDIMRKEQALFEPREAIKAFKADLAEAKTKVLDLVQQLGGMKIFDTDHLTREEREQIMVPIADATLAAMLQAISIARPDVMNLLNQQSASAALSAGTADRVARGGAGSNIAGGATILGAGRGGR